MILAGDIGGTHTRLALFRERDGRLGPVAEETYDSPGFEGLEAILQAFTETHAGRPERACFGVAGPVIDGRCQTTNLPWMVEAAALARVLGLPAAGLINDLAANAYGIGDLPPADLLTLNAGAKGAAGHAAIIAAGTGLGEAGLYWDGRRHHPLATEGGHAGFAPADELQLELLRHLMGRFGHVSWERVVSGPGLHNIYLFLRDSGRGVEPSWLAEALRGGDPPAVISDAALQGRSPLCAQALDLFVTLYGAEAGNLALKMMATGGVYLGGGIAPRLLEPLRRPGFLSAFTGKGRMQPLLESMPVRVILNPRTALLGAARCAVLGEGVAA
jgi:glucokinase